MDELCHFDTVSQYLCHASLVYIASQWKKDLPLN